MVVASKHAAVDQAMESSASKRRRMSSLRELSDDEVKALSKKKIYDNLRDLSEAELDGNVDAGGQTLRKRLEERIRLNAQDPATYPLGKLWYSEARETFRNGEHPRELVAKKADEIDEPVADELVQLMAQWHGSGSRSKVLAWLQMAETLTASEFLGFMDFALSMRPCSASKDALQQCLKLCEHFARMDVHDKHSGIFYLIKSWVDDVMVAALAAAKGNGRKPGAFSTTHRKSLAMLMPVDALDKVVAHRGKWTLLSQELVTLTTSCKVGLKLFSGCSVEVTVELVNAALSEDIDQFMQTPKIDEDKLQASLRKSNAKIKLVPGFSLLAEKRQVQFAYRGRAYTYTTKSTADFLEHGYWVEIKTRAVNAGELIAIGCEKQLASGGKCGLPGQFSDSLLARCRAARADVNAGLEAGAGKSGIKTVAWLNKNRKSLEITDPSFSAEIAFFTGMTGIDGGKALQQMAMAIMPTEAVAVDLNLALTEMKALQSHGVYAFCEDSYQNGIKIAADLLQDVVHGRSPHLAAKSTDFLQEFKGRLKFFCRFPGPRGKPAHVGEAAAKKMVEHLVKSEDKVALADMEDAVRFCSWLLSAADKQVVQDLRKKLQDKAGPSAAASSCKAGSSGAASSSKAAKQAVSELNAALKMFGKKAKA